ncbi:MAG: L,D-transpeptidase family protein [Planctomycetota bacterium]
MQTLKTAAIVVLLMTVMYGAYVSLTTPPEPVPAEIEQMLASEDGSLAIDVGLPASLGEMEFGDSVAFPEATDATDPMYADPSMGQPTERAIPSNPTMGFSPGVNGDIPVTASLTDAGPSLNAVPSMGLSPQDMTMPSGGPSFDGLGAAPSASQPNYPVTSNTFDVPNPNDASNQLDTLNQSGPGSPLALTSGTSETLPPGATPTLGSPSLGNTTLGGEPGIRMSSGVSNALRTADKQYAEDRRKEALATLSLFYHSPSMSGEERSALLARLDPLAREVIYSKRHLLEQPYRVGQKETLMDVALRYEVPWQLLANINEISDPVTVLPGTELKVVRGPFRAEVNLTTQELTLFLNDLYAGRFPIGVGSDPPPQPGTFTVQDKQMDRTFYNAAGAPISPGSPENPYGKVWLDLGGQLSIHGSPSTTSPTNKGCISLAGDFADDLYGILSQGSTVTIRR